MEANFKINGPSQLLDLLIMGKFLLEDMWEEISFTN